MRIVFITDLHGTVEYVDALARSERGADLLLVGGDITNFGGEAGARAVMEPLLRSFAVVRAVPGNVDRPEVLEWLEAHGLSLHGRGERVGRVALSGCGGSTLTPLLGPTELPETAVASLLARGARDVRDGRPWLLVTHVPPYESGADRVFLGKHVGSTALRDLLLASGPDLCLCGHIHEARGIYRVGDSLVVNPGAFSARKYAVVEVDGPLLRPSLRELTVSRGVRLRADAWNVATKVTGYARHRRRG
jgi:hypothetical protein